MRTKKKTAVFLIVSLLCTSLVPPGMSFAQVKSQIKSTRTASYSNLATPDNDDEDILINDLEDSNRLTKASSSNSNQIANTLTLSGADITLSVAGPNTRTAGSNQSFDLNIGWSGFPSAGEKVPIYIKAPDGTAKPYTTIPMSGDSSRLSYISVNKFEVPGTHYLYCQSADGTKSNEVAVVIDVGVWTLTWTKPVLDIVENSPACIPLAVRTLDWITNMILSPGQHRQCQ